MFVTKVSMACFIRKRHGRQRKIIKIYSHAQICIHVCNMGSDIDLTKLHWSMEC